MEINRTSGTAGERAFLVSVLLDDQGSYQADPLEELADLGESAGATVVGRLTQRRQTPDKTTYLGSGKVGELKLQAEAEDADVVVFDNNLSPAQIRNLEKVLGIKVLDRTVVGQSVFTDHRGLELPGPGGVPGAVAVRARPAGRARIRAATAE